MHNMRLQLARASHWHIVINVLPVCRISQRRLSLIWAWDGWGCRSDSGIIVGDSLSLSVGRVGHCSGLQRTLKNCKSSLRHLNMCPAELAARTQNERGGRERGKKSVLHSQMILIWCGLECNLDQT